MIRISSSFKKILLLVILLAVPGLLYYLLQEKGKNRYHPLDIFGPKQVSSTFHTKRGKKIADTIYHTVNNFKLTNQANEIFNYPADSSTITVVNFFFSRCPSFCASMNSEMARVAKQYSNNKLLQFISITVNPEYDTPEVLKKYAEKYNIPLSKWQFLTGSQDSIYKLARQSFMVDAINDTTKLNIIHSPMLILLDPQKRIRGYYDSTNKEQVDKLANEIKVLIAEELRKIKFP